MGRILAPLFLIAPPALAQPGGLPGQPHWLALALAALVALPVLSSGLSPVAVRGRR